MNNKICLFMIFILLFSIVTIPVYAIKDSGKDKHKDKINEDIKQKKCQKCHGDNVKSPSIDKTTNIKGGQIKDQSISGPTFESTSTSGNYTTVLEVGQTPQQLGFTFGSGSITGWQWWDTDGFGSEEQKNMVILSILDNSTGTIKPVSGLASLPTWPQASYRNHGGTYSYKADTDPSPISTQNNYPDKTEIWMVKAIDLTDISSATLVFWTWYSMETDWDYGYVAVSTDGNSWTNLPGTLTTTTNPNGNNLGNGITGNSGGNWVQETMDLTPYTGNKILLGFRFKSDEAVNEEGWYVDDISVSGGVFNDDAETLEIKTLSVNVTYPKLAISGATDPLTPSAGLTYSQGIQQVNLQEYLNHPGTYYGYFTSGSFAQQYSGNYVVSLDTIISSTPISATTQFQTTTYGCQSCHNKKLSSDIETSYVHGEGGGMQSCAYLCHAGSRGLYGDGYMGPPIDANPMHVHEMIYGHQGGFLSGAYYAQPPYNVQAHVNLSCQQCHTSFINNNTGPDTASVANYTLHGTNITYSSGTHQSLTCQNCHGDLTYPNIPQSQYTLSGNLGSYAPTFTSSRSFTDTFVIDVNSVQNITLSVTGDANKRMALYVIGPVDNTTKGLQGPCYGNPCYIAQNLPIDLNIQNPYKGRWLANVIMLQEGTVNYTITSSYPIESKPIIKIPECSQCHKPGGSGNADTQYEIPNWNPGFAHADVDKDGTYDVQCRTCHNTVHDVNVKKCTDCHTTAPIAHPTGEPQFSQYTNSQCLTCHGDPHKVTGGDSCIACHQNDVNISKFGRHENLNTSDGLGVVSDNDCWTCHRNKDMNVNNIYLCQSCHINSSGIVPVNDQSLLVPELSHGEQQCKSCHAPVKYHMNGTVGPKGLMDLFSFG